MARRQGDAKITRRRHRVFEEQLVEVAQTEKQQGIRNLLLDRVILPHQRRRFFIRH